MRVAHGWAGAGDEGVAQVITADTITDEQIRKLRDSVPRGHVDAQWCDDALGSHHHPMRRRNCRRECARVLNERGKRGAP